MRVVLFLLLSIFVIANLAADNDIWEVTAHGAKKVDLSTINYFSQAGRVKRSAQSVLKTNSLTWQLVYEDVNLNTNVGFDDPVEGPKVSRQGLFLILISDAHRRFLLLLPSH